jgi:hypothetical protein
MSTAPSTHGGDGRRPDGKFAQGNRLGRGNPLAGRAARIRAVLLRELTPTAARKIARELIRKAESGDLAAAREILDRTIGKASETELRERIDALEALIGERQDHDGELD